MVMNKGFKMCCKAVTSNFFIVVGILPGPSTYIVKPKGYIEAYLFIGKPHITVTSIIPVIYSSLYIYFFFSNIMISNSISHRSIGWWWSTVGIYFVNSADLYVMIIRTIKMKFAASRNCLSITKLIKGGYVIFQGPSISWKIIVETIKSKFSKNSLIPIYLS